MCTFNSKIKKIIYIASLSVFAISLCTGCGSERKEEQRELRLKGITLMENGKYEEALEEFQGALDLSLGQVGDVETDICFYKAESF